MDIQAITLFYLRQGHFENITDLNSGIKHAIIYYQISMKITKKVEYI